MSELYGLYKLHKIDSALYSLRQEAAALDTGQEETKRLKEFAKAYEEVGGEAKRLMTEQKDRELQQQAFAQKIESFNKKLYDGSIVSPREIENIEKEIEMLRSLSEKNDERLLELYDLAPPAVKEAEAVKSQIDEVQAQIKAKRDNALARHGEIKAEYDALKSKRPEVAREVSKELRERYEEIRKRTGDVAMADVTDAGTCSQCGTNVPTKQSQLLDEDRLVMCESCHRILFKAVPTR